MAARTLNWIAALLFAMGVTVRCALYFPLAAFPIDSDGVLAGLCAFGIAHGQHPMFFPGGSRLSAASCYVAAGYFHLFGDGRLGLALTGLTWAILYLGFSWLFLRTVLGANLGCVAFIFSAIPSAAFMTVTYIPWAYGEIMASCAATLWLAALWRMRASRLQRFAFGFSVGLGIWVSFQTLMIALPAIVWVFATRRRHVFSEIPMAIAGAIAGITPWLVANASHGYPSLLGNWAAMPTSSAAQVAANLVWLVNAPLPQLLFYGFSSQSLSILIIAGFLLVGIGIALAVRKRYQWNSMPLEAREICALLLLVAASCILLYVFSAAGQTRGWTVRYIAPLYLALPPILAIGAASLWKSRPWLAAFAVALVVIPNLTLYSLPGTAARAVLAAQLRDDATLRQRLAQANVHVAYGDYFVVYHINFDSGERIAAIPTIAGFDYMHYADALSSGGLRWAVLGYYPDQVQRWARAAGMTTPMQHIGSVYFVVATETSPNTANMLATLRRAGH